mgnify:CR=1 FL=1
MIFLPMVTFRYNLGTGLAGVGDRHTELDDHRPHAVARWPSAVAAAHFDLILARFLDL